MTVVPPIVYGANSRQPPNFLTLVVWIKKLGIPIPVSLHFPVMPESIMFLKQYLTTVTPTQQGGWVDDFGFAPSPIDISGTFGYNTKGFFNGGEYTGFGWVKYLEWIVDLSHDRLDDGSLPEVWLMSHLSQHFYEVELMTFNMGESTSRNMLWTYAVKATILGPIAGTPVLDSVLAIVAAVALENKSTIAEAIGKVKI